jgi:hypothetical protein
VPDSLSYGNDCNRAVLFLVSFQWIGFVSYDMTDRLIAEQIIRSQSG